MARFFQTYLCAFFIYNLFELIITVQLKCYMNWAKQYKSNHYFENVLLTYFYNLSKSKSPGHAGLDAQMRTQHKGKKLTF